MEDMAVLYGVPKVAYGLGGCTPFPMCVRACAEYLGVPVGYTQIMALSGAAFRLTWDTSCWNGGNVDVIFAFDDPAKVFACGMRAMGRSFRMLGRTHQTQKEAFMAFIRAEIDAGNPVIALGVIGPPEACVIAGYRDGGDGLMGWNVFQEYPENRSAVSFEPNGYFFTRSWWENPETRALFATGTEPAEPFTPGEALRNAVEVLEGRMCGSYAKGLLAYDAWRSALLCERDFPKQAVFPVLVERMMCHGDAMDCLSDGRYHAAQYMRGLAVELPAHADALNAAAEAFEGTLDILCREMVPAMGGWGREEAQMRRLADPDVRRALADQTLRMKECDARALSILKELARRI